MRELTVFGQAASRECAGPRFDYDRRRPYRRRPTWRDTDKSADLNADIVAPGLIDIQVNGGFGVEVGADPASILILAQRLPETGVTAFLPTLITSPADFYPQVFDAMRAAGSPDGAEPLGLHLEGPFLSPCRAGAHKLALDRGGERHLVQRIA